MDAKKRRKAVSPLLQKQGAKNDAAHHMMIWFHRLLLLHFIQIYNGPYRNR